MARFRAGEAREERRADFGDRRSDRNDQRRGSRPVGRSSAIGADSPATDLGATAARPSRPDAEEAAFSARRAPTSSARPDSSRPDSSRADSSNRQAPRSSRSSTSPRPRDNSSRFDD